MPRATTETEISTAVSGSATMTWQELHLLTASGLADRGVISTTFCMT